MIYDVVYFFCGALCHQLPERSFMLAGHKLPLCARCSGSVMGVFSCVVFLLAFKRLRGNKPPSIIVTLILAVSVIPLIIDGAASFLGIWGSSAEFRLLTGILAGYIFPIFAILTANYDVNKYNNIPIIYGAKDILIILLIALFLTAGIYLLRGFYIAWLITAVIEAITVVCLYSVIPWFILRRFFAKSKFQILAIGAVAIGLMLSSSVSLIVDLLRSVSVGQFK